MKDELIIITGLDQSLDVNHKPVFEKVKELIYEAIDRKDYNAALDVCRSLRAISQLSGMALARAFYLIRENWDKFETEDKFETAYEYVGVAKETIDRYISVEEMYAHKEIPEEFVEQIREHNIKAQIPIALAIAQGHEIDDEDWKKLANAPDYNAVAREIRDIKKQPPRSNALQIIMDKQGYVWVYVAGERHWVGELDIESEEESVQKAINRIVNNTGMTTS